MSDNDVMTFEEAMKLLKVSSTTLYRMVNDGRIPARKIGRQWRFSRRVLMEWLESGESHG
jgi:excisionase family DNA binding protein